MVQYWSKRLQYYTVHQCLKCMYYMHINYTVSTNLSCTSHTQYTQKCICSYMQDMILHVKLHTDVQLELMKCVYWEQNIKSTWTENKTEYKHIFLILHTQKQMLSVWKQDNLVLQCINWVDNVNWPLQRDLEADAVSVVPSSEQIKELWVVSGLYTERWSNAIGFVPGNVKNKRIN